jgi:DNA-binding MarR family transcriptional regulator
MNVTPKQLELLAAINSFQLKNGYSPTLAVLSAELKIVKESVYGRLEELVKKGCVTKRRSQARSVEITELGKQLLKDSPSDVVVVPRVLAQQALAYMSSHPDAEDAEYEIEQLKEILK